MKRFIKNKKMKLGQEMLIGIAVILVLLILIVLRKNAVKKQEESAAASLYAQSVAESESASEAASIEASIAESLAAVQRLSLKECGDPGLKELVSSYFSCRLAADTEGLYEIFGRTDKSADEVYQKQLQAQNEWIRSFDNIEVYTLPGLTDDAKAGIIKYRVNFRRVNTKAPGVMYFYAEKDSSGKWHLVESLTKDMRELMESEFEEAGVQEIIDENTIELREALASDSNLALMYESFMNGEIYSDYNLDSEREQEVNLFLNPEDSMLVGK